MPIPAREPIDYAPAESRRPSPAVRRAAVLTLVAVALLVAVPFVVNGYTASRFGGVRPGMTRAEVDHHLWAFPRRTSATYPSGGRAPGQVPVTYELFGLGKFATITVTFGADGLVSGAIPNFNN